MLKLLFTESENMQYTYLWIHIIHLRLKCKEAEAKPALEWYQKN